MARGGGGGGRGGGGRGGFRGGHHGGHHGGYHGGYHGGRGGRGGCLGNLIVLPFIIIAMLFSYCDGSASNSVTYSESAISSYSAQQYDEVFGKTESYEDNLLLTFLIYEDRYDYSYIAWVGDHINDTTFAMLGDNGTRLGQLLSANVAEDYTYSLASNLASAIYALADEIDAATTNGSYTCSEAHEENPSAFINHTDMNLNDALLTQAINYFTETTGIPFVLVVEDAEEVFD